MQLADPTVGACGALELCLASMTAHGVTQTEERVGHV